MMDAQPPQPCVTCAADQLAARIADIYRDRPDNTIQVTGKTASTP
jgi:hypothetical protein